VKNLVKIKLRNIKTIFLITNLLKIIIYFNFKVNKFKILFYLFKVILRDEQYLFKRKT